MFTYHPWTVVYLGPLPSTDFLQGMSNMVNFVDCRIVVGPLRLKGEAFGKMFIPHHPINVKKLLV